MEVNLRETLKNICAAAQWQSMVPKICEILGLIPRPQNRKKVGGYVSSQQLRQRASLVCEAFEGGTSQGDEALTLLEP